MIKKLFQASPALLLISVSLILPQPAKAQTAQLILINPSTCSNNLLRGQANLRYGGRVIDSRDQIVGVSLTTKFSPQGGVAKRLPTTITDRVAFLGTATTSPPQRWVEVNGSIKFQRTVNGRVQVGEALVNRANYPCNPQPVTPPA